MHSRLPFVCLCSAEQSKRPVTLAKLEFRAPVKKEQELLTQQLVGLGYKLFSF